ncbi:hypothetical protein CHARACLAT_026363 [Characodon lateralis]|uniref:Uncharacterized protein n=1 Tax=Characodon lateralis TaxID=208331 RepID=A0ABU7EWX8_9TELE|nr:hypothetical protein [Characodon lateralis]
MEELCLSGRSLTSNSSSPILAVTQGSAPWRCHMINGASSPAWRLEASSSSTTTSTGGIMSIRPDIEVKTAAAPAEEAVMMSWCELLLKALFCLQPHALNVS